MKFLSIFTVLLVIFVAYTTGQRCEQQPREPSCRGRRNEGRGGRDCDSRRMWYYDAEDRECREFRYLGCGGNNNRYCTKDACEDRCRRRDD